MREIIMRAHTRFNHHIDVTAGEKPIRNTITAPNRIFHLITNNAVKPDINIKEHTRRGRCRNGIFKCAAFACCNGLAIMGCRQALCPDPPIFRNRLINHAENR